MQAACFATVHVPSSAQQAPSGWTHGFGSQTPPMVQVEVPVQAACFATVHVPSSAQQAPSGWTHEFGSQTPPTVHVQVQFAWVVTVQVPLTAQQEPFGGAVGLSSPSHPTNTIAAITATINRLRTAGPPSFPPTGSTARLSPTMLDRSLCVGNDKQAAGYQGTLDGALFATAPQARQQRAPGRGRIPCAGPRSNPMRQAAVEFSLRRAAPVGRGCEARAVPATQAYASYVEETGLHATKQTRPNGADQDAAEWRGPGRGRMARTRRLCDAGSIR